MKNKDVFWLALSRTIPKIKLNYMLIIKVVTMKKMKACCSFCCLAFLFLSLSCTKDGFDDKEAFSGGVANAQLESPELTAESFSTLAGSDGTERVKVEWPVVYGAGGYRCSVSIVDDPSNPQVVVKDSVIDACSFTFKKKEDTKYEVSVLTLGNAPLNNKEARQASIYAYSTLVPAVTIPAGQEIAAFIKENLKDSESEQAFELEAGKTYQLDATVDCGLNTVTFRGNKASRPTVVVGEKGGFMTQGGLKIKFVNFDCTGMTNTALLALSKTPDASISTEALGYKALGANQDGYVIEDPVVFQECNIKNLPNGLVYGNKQPWSLKTFQVVDCMIQLANNGSKTFIDLSGSTNGLIKSMLLQNNTIYNTQNNSSAYFLRYSNSSNAQPKKIFGEGADATFTIENNTFCKVMSGKDFANNLANTNTVTANIRYNIFYDCYRMNKIIQSQYKKNTDGNVVYAVSKSLDSNDKKYGTEEDPQFAGPIDGELDLTQAKGGVNFVAGGSLSGAAGDPRWR